jgi:hypothetical protein
MSDDEFIVRKSLKGYSVELFRNGQHCVSFLDGVTQENAEREARNLAALWNKISVRRRKSQSVSLPNTISLDDVIA